MPVFWWVGLDLVFLVGRSMSGGVFWGVCGLIMILGSLSANRWGCVPVLLVVWHRAPKSAAPLTLSCVSEERTPSGDLHAEAGPHPKLNPGSCASKEEKGKFLPVASEAAD